MGMHITTWKIREQVKKDYIEKHCTNCPDYIHMQEIADVLGGNWTFDNCVSSCWHTQAWKGQKDFKIKREMAGAR